MMNLLSDMRADIDHLFKLLFHGKEMLEALLHFFPQCLVLAPQRLQV
jgi:hypothetical protein